MPAFPVLVAEGLELLLVRLGVAVAVDVVSVDVEVVPVSYEVMVTCASELDVVIVVVR